MARFTYEIQAKYRFAETEWQRAGLWHGMQRGYANGAFRMLKSLFRHLPDILAIRLVRSDNEVVDDFTRG